MNNRTSTTYRYYVEYIDSEANPKHKSIYIHTTSKLCVEEILDDYKIILIDQTD